MAHMLRSLQNISLIKSLENRNQSEKGRENRSASMVSKAQLYHGGMKTIWLMDGGPMTPKMIQLILMAVLPSSPADLQTTCPKLPA